MALPTNNEIRKMLNLPPETGGALSTGIPSVADAARPQAPQGAGKFEYDVPMDAIYDRLNDGSYVAKYENYKGATGNEDRLAKEQSWTERVGYGLGKNITKVGTYALDATIGTAYGVYNGIMDGKLSSVWDNDFSKKMDDWNKQLDYKLPNLYTDEEKSYNFFESLFYNPANFLANDVAGGLAFVAGALLPEMALGAITGGASLGGSAAKLGFGLFSKGAKAAKVVDTAVDTSNIGRNVLRAGYAAKFAEVGGNVVSTAGFLLRTSNFEAGMEARHNFKDAISNYLNTYEEKNGRPPTMEEFSDFTDKARKAGNYVYGANLAVLAISNAAMFGKAFNLKGLPLGSQVQKLSNKATNFANRAIGLGTKTELVEGVLTNTVRGANKAQRLLGNTYKVLGKASVEGIYEEGFQGVAGKSMQNYLEAKYDPKADSGFTMMASIQDSFAEQYGTAEGWKEMGIGMIIGFAGGVVQPGAVKSGEAFSGFGKNSRKAAQTQLEADVEKANGGITALRALTRSSSIRNFKNIADAKDENYESSSAENTMMNYEFIQSQEHMKSPLQVRDDYNLIIDNTTLDEEVVGELEAAGLDVNTYKESLKQEFQTDLEAYNFGKSIVSALRLDQNLKDTPGNLAEVKDALTMTFMLGKKSEKASKNVADQIGQLIGVDGMFDYMQHYAQLPVEQKAKIEELKTKREELAIAEQEAKKIGQKIAGIQVKGVKATREDTLKRKYEQEAQKLTTAQVRIDELTTEIDSIEKGIDSQLSATNFQLDSKSLIDNPNVTIKEVIDNMDKLDAYTKSLRAVRKKYEADSLDYLVDQFKMFSDANTQMINTARQMRNTNFFSSKQGKGLIKGIVGEKYSMTDDFKEAIESNNQMITDSISKFNNVSVENIDALTALQESIENNPNLSEREKYRLTSILRLQLGMTAIADKATDIMESTVIFSTEQEKAPSPLEGDTVVVKQASDIKARGIDNLDILNQTIEEITEQLDFIKDKSERSAGKIAQLNKEKEKLSEQTTAEQVKKQLEDQLVELEASEFKTPEAIEELKNQISAIEIKDNSQRISEIDEELKALETQYRIIDSPEYIRLNELYSKKEKGDITETEEQELTELEEDIDQWLLITGTVAGGLKLSDLIRQKVTLEQTPILSVEDVEVVKTADAEETITFTDKSGVVYYDIIQTYDAVTATKDSKSNLIEIAGISAIDLALEIGEEFEFTAGVGTNTILLTQDEVIRINALGKVQILPTNEDLTSNYSTVTTRITDIAGNEKDVPLRGNFQEEFTDRMNIPAVFAAKAGDKLTLVVDAKDAWNEKLLNEFQDAVGVPNMTEEQEDELVEARYENLLTTDEKYLQLLAEETKLKTEIKDIKLSEKDAAKKIKRLKTVGTQINTKEESLRNKAQKDVNKLKTSKASEQKIAEELDIIARSLVVKVYNADGEFVGVFKGVRSGTKGATGEIFESLRYQIAKEKDLVQRLTATRGKETLDISNITVSKVFMGHPTYNFIVKENGQRGVEYKRVDETSAKKIVDIGYVQNGVPKTKSQQKGVDTTFLSKHMQNKKKSKVPFIVLEVGGKRVAYPVKTITQEKEGIEEFETIFRAKTSDTVKATALNRFMASRGIDIKQPGAAFLAVGDNTNLNEEFFNDKLAQLKNIDYFYSLDNWIDPAADMESIIKEQVLVDIDLITPFHSPKLQMNLSEVEIKPEFRKSSQTMEDDHSDATPEAMQKLEEELRRRGESTPKEEIKEDCEYGTKV